MPDITGDAKERWDVVPACANINAPTAAECNGGVRVSLYMTKDGATGFVASTEGVDTSSKESDFKTSINGMISLSNPRFRFKRQTPLSTDPAFNATPPNGTAFVIRRNSVAATTSYSATQIVDVFPVQFSQRGKVDQADNMPELYEVPLQITSKPSYDVAVV